MSEPEGGAPKPPGEPPVRSLGPGDYYDYNFSRTIPTTLPAGTYFLAVDMGYRLVPAGQFTKF